MVNSSKTEHLDANYMAELLDNKLAPSKVIPVLEHLHSCPQCSHAIEELRSALMDEAEAILSPELSKTKERFYAIAEAKNGQSPSAVESYTSEIGGSENPGNESAKTG